MSINVVARVDDFVKVQNILVSVSDKGGLEQFIPELVEINPEIRIFSTGGTYGRINEILGDSGVSRLMQVSHYTGQPETQGGLVKTLDFKIYLGLLTETYNDAHQGDLKRTGSVPIDMVVVNLYPFKETISKPDVTVEQARGNRFLRYSKPTRVRPVWTCVSSWPAKPLITRLFMTAPLLISCFQKRSMM
ncbi:MAG: hypothetical protein P8Z42_11975 [Anaerolineales bacterium]